MTIPKPGDELTLRNGWKAKVLAVHEGQESCFIGEYFDEESNAWISFEWHKNGCWPGVHNGHYLDLIFPEPEKKMLEMWVNVYAGGEFGCHQTRKIADHWNTGNRIACIHIVQPYVEGEGL